MSPGDSGDPSLGLSSYGPQFPIVNEAVTHMACREVYGRVPYVSSACKGWEWE